MKTRRQFLRNASTLIALPMLESFSPRGVAADATGQVSANARAKRLVCVGAYLGLHAPAIYPKGTGSDYELTPLLQPLAHLRGDFTLFSGLDHRAPGGHGNWPNFLCGKKIRAVTLDQQVAAKIGGATRFASLVLAAGSSEGGVAMSYGEGGVALPSINRPSVLYKKMFASDADRQRTEYLLKSGHSALDRVLDEARAMQKRVSSSDRVKLDEYFTSIREVETRMGRQLEHLHDVVPVPDYTMPEADPVAMNQMLECEAVMLDLMAIALQTDSCRVLGLRLPGESQVFTIDGQMLKFSYHSMSHHGNDPVKVGELIKVDTQHMRLFARFIEQLKTKTDAEGRALLDSTIVMWGSGMGDASLHGNTNIPTLVAGGGLKHGRHLALARRKPSDKEILLGDLFITLQRQLGIECNRFCEARNGMDELLA
ncbi:MAG: DUF1552 domain-containing protein [Prosthecobacter sp.]|uniref:DUF1552 domain-containing protein n=1 Tax=Prosthecobacter sp. TaxID=1965333 RepID=UPI00390258DF